MRVNWSWSVRSKIAKVGYHYSFMCLQGQSIVYNESTGGQFTFFITIFLCHCTCFLELTNHQLLSYKEPLERLCMSFLRSFLCQH